MIYAPKHSKADFGPANNGETACILADRAHHSGDMVEVWHGQATPALACGYHAANFLTDVYVVHNAQLAIRRGVCSSCGHGGGGRV